MQQGAASKKKMSQKEVAKQKQIIPKETAKKTLKITGKKVKTKRKSFQDCTPVMVLFIRRFKKFGVTLGLIASQ
jgi:hypothetical protein